MATNIEIKARAWDPAGLKERVERLCASTGEVLLQEDTFFRTSRGRLKLRVVTSRGRGPSPDGETAAASSIGNPGKGAPAEETRSGSPETAPGRKAQLIYYERSDVKGPKRSDYIVVEIDDPAGLKALLAAALGIRGTVRKTRRLYILGRTRIHLDEVEGLGSFVELEVVTEPGRQGSEGNAAGGAASRGDVTEGSAAEGNAGDDESIGGSSFAGKTTEGEKTAEKTAAEDGETEAAALMERLGIRAAGLVDGAYIDLLEARGNRRESRNRQDRETR